jgi:alanyl-tRNA synthetase
VQQQRHALDRALAVLSTTAEQAPEAIRRLQADTKRLGRENEQLKLKVAMGGASSAGGQQDDAIEVRGVKVVARSVPGLEKGALRGLSDSLRGRLESGVVVLASEHEGRVSLVVSVTKDLAGRVHAGSIVKQVAPIVGGGGGGRPDFAEAGGKDASRIDELLTRSREVVAEMLGATA